MRSLKCYDVTLPVTAPFHFPAEDVGALGYDSIGQEKDGRPLIPREQVRGLLRHGLLALCEVGHPNAPELLSAFGHEGPNIAPTRRSEESAADANAEFPAGAKGLISVTDAIGAAGVPERVAPSPRVKLGYESGAAEPGHLLLTEQKLPPEAEMCFVSQIHIYQDPVKDYSDLIRLAFEFHDSIGALKSVGFGRMASPVVKQAELAPAFDGLGSIDPEQTERITWTFTLDRPYLVDAARPSANVYEGRLDIPGAALKGLLARHLSNLGRMDNDVSDGLSRLVIGFASPSGSLTPFPLSVFADKHTGKLFDLAADDAEIHHKVELQRAVDWKPSEQRTANLNALFEWMGQSKSFELSQGYESRVHVEIDKATGAVVPHKLYTSIAREVPEKGFSVTLDFANVVPEIRGRILDALRDKMSGLGRTDAVIETAGLQADLSTDYYDVSAGRVAILITTPSLMVEPKPTDWPHDAYSAFWLSKLPSSRMVSHFSSERLAGGYQAMRFGVQGEYRPFVLTEPGTVFVLDLHEDDLGALQALLRFGVCIDNWGGAVPTWQNCPFVPENGYGRLSRYTPFNDGVLA
jgi:hypothetical protein